MNWTENRTARWSVATAVLCLVLFAVTWFALITPRRDKTAELGAQQVAEQQTNDLLRTRLEELRVQFAKLADSRGKLAEIRQQIPVTADMPGLLRSVDALATAAGVELVSVSPGTPQTVTGRSGQAGAAGSSAAGSAASAGTAETSGAGAGTAATGTAAGTGTAGTTGTTGTAGTTAGAGSLVGIPVSIVVSGDYFETVAFLRKLQTEMPRAMLVSALQVTAAPATATESRDTVKVTITGQVFSRPDGSTTTGSSTGSGTSGATSSGTSAGTSSGTSAGTSAGTSSGTSVGTSSGTSAGTSSGTSAGIGSGTPSTPSPSAAAASQAVPLALGGRSTTQGGPRW